MNDLTEQQLDELARLEEAATATPWGLTEMQKIRWDQLCEKQMSALISMARRTVKAEGEFKLLDDYTKDLESSIQQLEDCIERIECTPTKCDKLEDWQRRAVEGMEHAASMLEGYDEFVQEREAAEHLRGLVALAEAQEEGE